MKTTIVTLAIVLGILLGILRWIRPDGFSAGAHYTEREDRGQRTEHRGPEDSKQRSAISFTHVPTVQEEAAAGFQPAPARSKGFRVQPM